MSSPTVEDQHGEVVEFHMVEFTPATAIRNTLAVCKRELKSYFTTPSGWVIIGAFALLAGLYFTFNFMLYADSTIQQQEQGVMQQKEEVPDMEEYFLSPYLVLCGQLLMFIGPLVTMRLLAEERHKGTMELLLTLPLSDRQIVFGKYLASLGMVLLMILLLIPQMGIVAWATDVEWPVLVFGLLTVFLMGAAFMSMGLFVSAMTSSQVTAGAWTFLLWLTSWTLGRFGESLPDTLELVTEWPAWAQEAVLFAYSVFRNLVIQLPLDAHALDMAEGVVTLHDIAYYLLFIAFFLFLTLRVFETRRWRG